MLHLTPRGRSATRRGVSCRPHAIRVSPGQHPLAPTSSSRRVVIGRRRHLPRSPRGSGLGWGITVEIRRPLVRGHLVRFGDCPRNQVPRGALQASADPGEGGGDAGISGSPLDLIAAIAACAGPGDDRGDPEPRGFGRRPFVGPRRGMGLPRAPARGVRRRPSKGRSSRRSARHARRGALRRACRRAHRDGDPRNGLRPDAARPQRQQPPGVEVLPRRRCRGRDSCVECPGRGTIDRFVVFRDRADGGRLRQQPARPPPTTIGPTRSATARTAGGADVVEAVNRWVDGIADPLQLGPGGVPQRRAARHERSLRDRGGDAGGRSTAWERVAAARPGRPRPRRR